MRQTRPLISLLLFALGGVLAVVGILGVVGAGGDNGQRAESWRVAGRQFSTYLVGGVGLVVGVAMIAAAVLLVQRRRLYR